MSRKGKTNISKRKEKTENTEASITKQEEYIHDKRVTSAEQVNTEKKH